MAAKPSGSYTVRRIENGVIETTVHGRVDDAVVLGSGNRALELMKEQPAWCYIIDARDSTTYDPSVVRSGKDIASTLFKHGIREIIAITDSSIMRMLGTTIAFALSDTISFVSTRDEALARVRSRAR